MIKLSFCRNDFPIGGSFWQKDSLITHILFELCLFRNLAQGTFFLLALYMKLMTIAKNIINELAYIKHVLLIKTKRISDKKTHFVSLWRQKRTDLKSFWSWQLFLSFYRIYDRVQSAECQQKSKKQIRASGTLLDNPQSLLKYVWNQGFSEKQWIAMEEITYC